MQISRTFLKQTLEHFYMGVIVTLVYVLVAPKLIGMGYPGFGALLFVELFVLTPLVLAHLFAMARKSGPPSSLRNVVGYRQRIGWRRFTAWYVIGLLAIFASYVPLYPVGLAVRDSFFAWLPEWYFNPGYGVTDVDLLAKLFLVGILVDGLIAPVMEELFFRGYLLPRMEYLKGWAPVINGAFFGLYHFWQPHNLIALVVGHPAEIFRL